MRDWQLLMQYNSTLHATDIAQGKDRGQYCLALMSVQEMLEQG